MELKDALLELERIADTHRDRCRLVVQVNNPGSIGGTPCVPVSSIEAGFDWDSGKLLLRTEKPLTVLSSEDLRALHESASKGQSWHTYQILKKKDARIRELEDELSKLNSTDQLRHE